MLYTLFMFWVIASISVVVGTIVLAGVVCTWCAFIGRRRARLGTASLLVHRHSPPPAAP
jgi:hypothetical protein